MEWQILKTLLSSPVIQKQMAITGGASLATSYMTKTPLTSPMALVAAGLSLAMPFAVLVGGEVEMAEYPVLMPAAAVALTFVLVKVL